MNNTKLSSCLDLVLKQRKYIKKLEEEVNNLKKELIVDKSKLKKEKKDMKKNIKLPLGMKEEEIQNKKKKKKIEKK